MKKVLSPTEETYASLRNAYALFNKRLFAGELPECLITIQDRRQSYGYFVSNRFHVKHGKATSDEIALNPEFFDGRSDRDIFSTLLHEMVHLWQHHYGKPGKNGYHNKQWAKKMKEVGLCASTTGQEGGMETGYRCSHYIPDGGPFVEACRELKRLKFHIRWAAQPRARSAQPRARFVCPLCSIKAYALPHIKLICGTCHRRLEVT